MMNSFFQDPYLSRQLLALALCLAYAAFCFVSYRRAHAAALPPAGSGDAVWVIHASQTGQAEMLAAQSAQALAANGIPVRQCRLDQDWQGRIQDARCLLFVVSTAGEGAAPDHALGFAGRIAQATEPALAGKAYGVLALGDSNYANFCGFGRRLDAWLQRSGGLPLFPRVDVDRLSAQALAHWQQRLERLGAARLQKPWAEQSVGSHWRLLSRRCLNAGSPGVALYKVLLQPADAQLVDWQAGDLVDVWVPGGDGRARTYSIANLPGGEGLELIVRSVVRPDGQLGEASGWLNHRAMPGDELRLALHPNPGFHLPVSLARPLILIGAGSGLAGLRGHLQARARAWQAAGGRGEGAWLIFGERSGHHDRLCADEIQAWRDSGMLARTDLCFSRDEQARAYVQDRVLEQAELLREWLARGADILICGSAAGMGRSVDAALRSVSGGDVVDELLAQRRILRDVY